MAIYCTHVGDLAMRYPGCDMRQRCPHEAWCPVCGYGWDCPLGCVAGPEEDWNEQLREDLDAVLREET